MKQKNKSYIGYSPKSSNIQKLNKYIAQKADTNNTLRGKQKTNKRFA